MTNNYLIRSICLILIILDIFILIAILRYLYHDQNKLGCNQVTNQSQNANERLVCGFRWSSKGVNQAHWQQSSLEENPVNTPKLLGLFSRKLPLVDRGQNYDFRMIYKSFYPISTLKPLLFSRVMKIYSRFQQQLKSLSLEWWGVMSLSQAHTVKSFVFGVLPDKSEKINPQYKTIGIYHVVSASGYNLSLILASFTFLSRGKSFITRGFIHFLLVWSYVTCCGFSPSITRAGIMASAMIGSQLLHRQYHALRSLVLTVLLVGVMERQWIGSLSFQLSVAATLALIIWMRSQSEQTSLTPLPMTPISVFHQLFQTQFKSVFLSTLAIQTTTMPLILDSFGSWPIITLVANPMVLWLTPVVTILGLWYISLSLIIMKIGFGDLLGWSLRWWLGLPLRTVLNIFKWLVDVIGNHTFGFITVENWSIWHSGFWMIALVVTWFLVQKQRSGPRIVSFYET